MIRHGWKDVVAEVIIFITFVFIGLAVISGATLFIISIINQEIPFRLLV